MLIGIDVGGTYTDGVLFSDGEIIHHVKHPTDEENLEKSLLAVLDDLTEKNPEKKIRRVVLSTTLVTNLLAAGKGERTALILLPGRGLPWSAYNTAPDTWFLKGGIDFRGREVEAPDRKEIERTLAEIDGKGIRRVAVVGKFSNRNDAHEKLIAGMIADLYPRLEICRGNHISGRLNFPRRAATCYYTAMTMQEWNRFSDTMEKAISKRLPGSVIHILKADGGTATLDGSRNRPCETVFSGPAASTVGGSALSREKVNSVVVDIGGTTTDIALLIDGLPLYASKGAVIGGQLTHIHSFAVDSLALGGDTPLSAENGEVILGKRRRGPAACFGGHLPTVTDAFSFHLGLKIGDEEASRSYLEKVAGELSVSVGEVCRVTVDKTTTAIAEAIRAMFHRWEEEPAYKVWEVVHEREFHLQRIIGIGAAAPAVVPLVAEKMGVGYLVHPYSPVANALGAAVARPTLEVQVHADTESGTYTVSPGGKIGSLNRTDTQIDGVKKLALRFLKEIGEEQGLGAYTDETRFYMEEQFNMIRGWSRAGKLFDVGVEITPGFVHEFTGVEE